MAMTFAHSAPSAHASAPRLGAPATIKYYRRSTTNKAPRKRTFLVVMTKFNAKLAAPAGVPEAFANTAAILAGGKCFEEAPEIGGYGGDGCGNVKNGRGGNNNNNNNSNNGGFGFFGDSAPQLVTLLSQLGQALLGALVLTVAVAAFPGHSQATTSQALTDSHAPAARPRSKVLHVSCKGGTLVVPLPAGGDAKAATSLPRAGPFTRSKVVEAPIELSGREAAIINQRQYFVRESMLV